MPPFSTRDEAGVLVVTIDDPKELNDFRTNAFRDALYETIQPLNSPRVALDLADTDFLSSSGIAILVGLKRRIDAHAGRLIITRVDPGVLNLLGIMKLTQYFTIAPSIPEAVAALRSDSPA